MMKCRHKTDKVLMYLLGELSEVEHAKFVKHVTQCDRCARHIEELKPTLTILNKVTPAPEDFSGGEDFIFELNHAIERRQALRGFGRFKKWRVAMGICLVLVGVSVFLNIGERNQVMHTPPSDIQILASSTTSKYIPVRPKVNLIGNHRRRTLMKAPRRMSIMSRPGFPKKPQVEFKFKKYPTIKKS